MLASMISHAGVGAPSVVLKSFLPRATHTLYPKALAPDIQRDQLYVLDGAGAIRAYDRSGMVLRTKTLTYPGTIMTYSPTSSRLYVYGQGRLQIMDALTFTQIGSVPLDGYGSALEVDTRLDRVYVVHRDLRKVTVVDGVGAKVTATISLAKTPRAAAFDASYSRLYVSTDTSDIYVVDTLTNRAVGVLAGGGTNGLMDIDSGRNRLYVAYPDTKRLDVIDTVSFGKPISRELPASPLGIAVSEKESRVYITDSGAQIQILDSLTGDEAGKVAVGDAREHIAIDPERGKQYAGGRDIAVVKDGQPEAIWGSTSVGPRGVSTLGNPRKVYASAWLDNRLFEIDPSNGAVLRSVSTPTGPVGPAGNRVTGKLYVASYYENSIAVFNGASLTLETSVAVGVHPVGLAVDSVRNRIFVSSYDSNLVHVIDGSRATVISQVSITHPQGIAVDTATNKIYVTSGDTGIVTIIDGATLTATKQLTIPGYPLPVASDPVNGRVYVGTRASGKLVAISAVSDQVLYTVEAGSSPYSVAVDSVSDDVYISNNTGDSVSVITGASGTNLRVVSVGDDPWGVAWDSDLERLFVTHSGPGAISVIGSDYRGPTTSFTTPDGAQLKGLWFAGDEVRGTATDDLTGVSKVVLTFTNTDGWGAVVDASVTCSDTLRRSCTYNAYPPITPGTYRVRSSAIDRGGNSQTGPEITVHVL